MLTTRPWSGRLFVIESWALSLAADSKCECLWLFVSSGAGLRHDVEGHGEIPVLQQMTVGGEARNSPAGLAG